LPGKGRGEFPPVGGAGEALPGGGLRLEDPEGLAHVDVEAPPPADEGGKVVGGDDRQRRAGILLRPLERRALALEGQHPVAEDARFHDGVRKALRGGAEILGDHQAAGPVAFQAQDRQHRLEGIIDIGPLRGGSPGGNDEEAAELEGVVDPDRPRMAHVGHHQIAEGRKALLLQGKRIEGRQAPILPLRTQGSGGAPTERAVAKCSGAAQISDPPRSAPTARSR
jgi:hypothetical protein